MTKITAVNIAKKRETKILLKSNVIAVIRVANKKIGNFILNFVGKLAEFFFLD
jgi:hypothetical protein